MLLSLVGTDRQLRENKLLSKPAKNRWIIEAICLIHMSKSCWTLWVIITIL